MFEIIPIERRNRHVTTYDPFREMEEFERRFWGNSSMTTAFRTDVEDTGDAFKLEAELPGFDKEDITLDIKGGCLVISAEHKTENESKNENGKYIRKERTYGSYQRSFDISGVDADRISAAYNSGILTIDLPKKQAHEPEAKRLEIK